MFLKSLEIQGFKSFADKVYFSFSPGVTAIIGPNGSGKSNVVDAIRWVLGEQSAKTLRGAKMEDVIFSGSVDRKAVGMARVTMILDNSQRIFAKDCDEIEVSRTLYRSGESQYMLNKSACRLKDIQELFMDTGLGKDGFSVIGQGKIEEILTLHAEERRGLIEEAAGISKYKYRKREAERKLEATNDDMTRLDDILYELEKRLDPLAKQAEKVRIYRGLKEEADNLQLAHLTKQYMKERTAVESQEQDLVQSKQEAVTAQVRLDQMDADVSAEKLALEAKRHEMETLQVSYTEALRKTQESERVMGILAERREHSVQRADEIETAITKEAELLQTAHVQYQEALQAVNDGTQMVEAVDQEAMQKQQTLTATETALAQLKKDIDELQTLQFETLSKQAATNNEKTRLEQTMSGETARKLRLANRLKALEDEKEGLVNEITLHNNVATKLQASEQENQRTFEKTQTTLADEKRLMAALDERQRQNAHHLMQAKSRLDTLEEFEASGEGYFQGVQAVLRAKKEGRLAGVQGSVLQLMDVPSAYLTAIENALGGAAQNVVVETDMDAQQAISWLKKERRGRVTFMPLNLVNGKRQDITFQDDAVIGLALDVVHYEAKYEPIMAQLLGRVWVLRDLESATRLAKRTGSKYRFVTLDGDVIAPGGSMTGGHQKKQSSIVYRKHEMGVLRTKIVDFEKEAAVLAQQQAAKQQVIAELEANIHDAQAELQQSRLQLHEIAVVKNQQQEQLKRLQREIDVEILSRDELQQASLHAQEALATLEDQAIEIAEMLQNVEKRASEKRFDLQDVEEKHHMAQIAVRDVLIKKATIDEQHQTHLKQAKSLEKRVCELQRQLSDKQEEKQKLAVEMVELDRELETTKAALEQAMSQYDLQNVKIQQAKEQIDCMDTAIREQEKAVADARKNGDKLWRAYNTAEMQWERAQERIHHLEEQFQELFAYSTDEAIVKADLSLDTNHAVERLKNLRKKIDLLGEINFTALEEYEQVNEQVTFLRAQIEDLNLAKEKLEAIIHEMEVTMATRFKDAYEKVNEQFSQIFTAMFGGGRAHLELSMPGRYLETGVEIIAQPPGKKERVLTLLSGGERALTAAALLFALLEVRPSPFVILDEIEAALDEANVERFASFIMQYAHKTQFIIISHRKGTMEAASVLYGITMDSNGVSKQVSVRLSDFSET